MTGKGVFWAAIEGRAPVPPAARTLGFNLVQADPDHGTITVEFGGRHAFTNPYGEVLGGFLAAMLYDTVGPAVLATLGDGEFVATDDLHVDFLRAAAQGTLVGRAQIVWRVENSALVAGQLRDSSDELVATCTATVRIVPRKEKEQ